MSTSLRSFTFIAVVLVAGGFLAACTSSWAPRFGAQKTEVSPMPAGSLDEPTATPTTPTMMMGKDVKPLSNSTETDAIDKDLSSTEIEQEDFSDL